MSLNTGYSEDNVFARIIRGELPSVRVYEDEHTLAFMDAYPQTEGHVLVISKLAKAVNLTDLSEEELGFMMRTVQRVARAVVKALNPDGFRVAQFNGAAAGQTVYHTHVHILPVWEGRIEGPHADGIAEPEALEAVAERIRNELS